jgi:hypothetical protein
MNQTKNLMNQTKSPPQKKIHARARARQEPRHESNKIGNAKKKQIIRSEAKSQRIAASAALPDTTP